MKSQLCSGIKNLEKRLACLQEKYKGITDRLEDERANATSDDSENIHYILVEREFILKQIQILENRLKNKEKFINKKEITSSKVEVGTCVKLENHTHSLEVCLVSSAAQPNEGFVSTVSPIGQAILGRSLGDDVTINSPNGTTSYTIKEFI